VDDILVAGSDMAEFNKPKWLFPLVIEMKDRCSEKHVLSYLLTVGVTTVEWESRLQNSITIWAKLVRVLISKGSLSLLKIPGTKSLVEMFTMLVIKEKLKLCIASTGLRDNQLTESSTGRAGWHDLEVWHDHVVWHEPEQFSSELNNISLV
ncbi:hypothetical protein Tco_1460547, partial [Tanacetum coccineum]